jgi:hypothetical protein
LDWAEANTASLDEKVIVDEAVTAAGLEDFGPEDFWDRFRAQLDAVAGDGGLTEFSRRVEHDRAVALLTNRLLFTDLLRRYPEIEQIEIESPVIIVGMPRSGTTHLVNLLAADTRFRSLPFWEIEEPFPRSGDGPGRTGVDPRFERCVARYQAGLEMFPLAQAMHERSPSSIEEEVELQDLDFASYALEWHARVPTWRDYYLGIDQVERYGYLKTLLKALTFFRGPRRWVLKSPQHLEQLPALKANFPDATVAVTIRDPVAVIQSAVTAMAYVDRVRRHAIEPGELVDYWIDRVHRLLLACARDRDTFSEDSSVDVPFHVFMADDMAMVEGIYERAGIEMTDTARTQLTTYVSEHPRGRHGQISYDLEGQFDRSPGEIRKLFDFYFERFPARPEV